MKTIEELNLTFDALVLPQHLTNLIQFIEHHPNLKIVVDHGAKPFIKNNIIEPWASDINKIAEFPQVYCKLSGLVTEAGMHWSWSQLLPYIDHLFSSFGHERIMWGSDFPVLNLANDYHAWYKFSRHYVSSLGEEAFSNVFCRVAERFYGI